MGNSAALLCIDPEVSGKCCLNEAALSLDPGIHSGTGTSGKGVKSQEPGSLEILFLGWQRVWECVPKDLWTGIVKLKGIVLVGF